MGLAEPFVEELAGTDRVDPDAGGRPFDGQLSGSCSTPARGTEAEIATTEGRGAGDRADVDDAPTFVMGSHPSKAAWAKSR